jgi:formate hydrogenlyase subunit 3/multisubunit Na+/H+ antiporter MnhD subunit
MILLQIDGGSTQLVLLALIILVCVYLYISHKEKKKQVVKDEKKYLAVRAIVNLAEIFAFLILTAAIVITFILLSNVHYQDNWHLPAIILSVGIFLFIIFLAQAQMIRVFLDIEENTRKQAKNPDEQQ